MPEERERRVSAVVLREDSRISCGVFAVIRLVNSELESAFIPVFRTLALQVLCCWGVVSE